MNEAHAPSCAGKCTAPGKYAGVHACEERRGGGAVAWTSEPAQASKAAALRAVGGKARKVLLPRATWYHTELPPKSTWKSVKEPPGDISAYSSTSGRGCATGGGAAVRRHGPGAGLYLWNRG